MKIRKPFVMGGMLLVAALLFLSMFMDMSAPQEMERQTISLRAEAEDLSIDDMINTSDKRKSPSNDVVAPGFAATSENMLLLPFRHIGKMIRKR